MSSSWRIGSGGAEVHLTVAANSSSNHLRSMEQSTPNQERAWNAYGHAMAAALGVELVLRVTNMTTGYQNILAGTKPGKNRNGRLEKLRSNALEGTFGQLAARFRSLHPDLITELLDEALSNAVDFRNALGHHFLSHHLAHLWTWLQGETRYI